MWWERGGGGGGGGGPQRTKQCGGSAHSQCSPSPSPCAGDTAWRWFDQVVGEGRCPIVDTWWQTETGSAMLTPLAGAHNVVQAGQWWLRHSCGRQRRGGHGGIVMRADAGKRDECEIGNSAGAWPTVPGCATLPFFGVQPVLLTEKVQLKSTSCCLLVEVAN